MKRLSVFLCSTCLAWGFSGPVKAEVQLESQTAYQTEVFRAEPVDPFASENKNSVIVRYPDSLWVASFLPGFGQILMDEPGRGLLFIGGFVASVPVALYLGSAIGKSLNPNPGFLTGLNEALIALMILTPGVYIWNLVDAYNLNHEKNEAAFRHSSVYLGPQGQLTWQVSAF